MRNILKAFKSNIHLWICPAVYIWGLAFQANIASADDPLFARIVDSATVLLTLVFWATAVGSVVILLAALVQDSFATRVSSFICDAAILCGTIYYFHRWLFKEGFLPHSIVVTLTGLIGCAGLGAWVFFRRQRAKMAPPHTSSTLQDCFQFGAIPIILSAALIVGIRVFTHLGHVDSITIKNVGAKAHGQSPSKPNVILIVMDALRAQSMSLYGYHRRTTPSIDRFAYHANVYLQAYSNSTITRTAITTLLTGKHPFNHGRISPLKPPYRSKENVLRLLLENGYSTAAITTNWDSSFYPLGFSEALSHPEISNFQLPSLHSLQTVGVRSTITGERMYNDLAEIWTVIGLPKKLHLYGPANSTLQRAWTLLNNLNQPFLLYIHIFEPHEPYQPSLPFDGMYSTKESEELIRTRGITFYAHYPPDKQATVDAIKDRYDESIAFLDHELGRFLETLERSSWGANTMVLLTSDHGESFDHGYIGHGEPLYESSTHIPLVIRWPGQKEGKRIWGSVQSTDIAPTILHAAGIPTPSWMDGFFLSSEGQVKRLDGIAINYRHPLNNNVFPSPTKLAIWWMPYKAIFDCETGKAELYNLNADPAETTDLSSKNVAVLAELREMVKRQLEKGAGRQLLSCAR